MSKIINAIIAVAKFLSNLPRVKPTTPTPPTPPTPAIVRIKKGVKFQKMKMPIKPIWDMYDEFCELRGHHGVITSAWRKRHKKKRRSLHWDGLAIDLRFKMFSDPTDAAVKFMRLVKDKYGDDYDLVYYDKNSKGQLVHYIHAEYQKFIDDKMDLNEIEEWTVEEEKLEQVD